MRYDSEPQLVRRLLEDADGLQRTLNSLLTKDRVLSGDFEAPMPQVESLLNTLDHFSQLHTLNPQFSLSPFSARHIEKKLSFLKETISKLLLRKEFPSLEARVRWSIQRFVHPETADKDDEQTLILLYRRIVQVLDSYYAKNVRDSRTVTLLNEFAGWMEHIETQGHHDVHGVMIFAEKVARDSAVIQHRAEVVRDLCLFLRERSTLLTVERDLDDDRELAARIAVELSQVYSEYLLQLYEALLEDSEIIAISNQNYHAFECYCQEHDIDFYDEYCDALKEHFREYVDTISGDISLLLGLVRTANVIVGAEAVYRRYRDLEFPEEVIGQNLSRDIRLLDTAIYKVGFIFEDVSDLYNACAQKLRRFKADIIRPAIALYGEYMRSSKDFFHQLSTKQTDWIPILDSALACLEQNDDFYEKCYQLKMKIDAFVAGHSR
ncbi:hypothetical protein CSB45_05760 [candidate division KSB3 bacterium]|uniref:Uncharacterized protein n=1 Tax=candidate division KSB3 bacterium TaxID=2044937 RepID=A0A2G6E783_9BACT|nr:MAG: hypothetical protein CSB45_05760 [candidate division KSB3 bacterium]PIE30156.1 MAG: hypothetical protein CSA57_04470 [candidate division KSB3 bacterium]